MDVPEARTFDEYIAILRVNGPVELVLGCWRRLELALGDYGRFFPELGAHPKREALERHLAADLSLGEEFATAVRNLRRRRNTLTHENTSGVSADASEEFARESLKLLGRLSRRIAELEGR